MKKMILLAGMTALSMPLFANDVLASNDEMTKSVTIYGNTPSMWNYRPVYSSGAIEGNAVITKSKLFTFESGINNIEVTDLPVNVEPSTIMLKNLGQDKSVLEQQFKSTVFNLGAVLEATIGDEIEVEQAAGDRMIYYRGTLISQSPNLVIREDDRLRVIDHYSSIVLADRDSDSPTNTVRWKISSESSSDDTLEYSYKTEGVSWSANYNLFVGEGGSDSVARLESWANIYNNTNLEAEATELKLVAGKVNSVSSPKMMRAMPMMAMADSAMEAAPAMGGSFQQESFSDFHMYHLPRRVDIEEFSSKKIKLYNDRNNVKIARRYEYDASTHGGDVKSMITISNDKASNMGVPLPAGKITVFEKDSTGSFEKAGEARISHKAVNHKIEFETGKSFDLRAKKTRSNEQRNNNRRSGSYTIKVELENSKGEPVTIYVKDRIYNNNWKISQSSHTYKKISANEVEFPINIPRSSKVSVTYKVDYSW